MLNAFGLDLEVVENKFRALQNDVKLIFFTRETDCPHCGEIRKLLQSLASITHKIEFDSYNFAINQEKDHEYGIFTVPALAIIGEKDYGIRYYGYPRGTEVNDFLDDIIYVSKGESTLKPQTAMKVALFTKPTQLKIFISPNCPYSLPVARLALKLAIASDGIHIDIIHADEFLELAEKYGVRGIPMTVVNEKKSFYGALDEEEYVNQILELA
jgi:glutaredoxin-like protein